MTDHDAADAANDRHAERMAAIDEQPDPRDIDASVAAEWAMWAAECLLADAKRLSDGTLSSTEQEAWWS